LFLSIFVYDNINSDFDDYVFHETANQTNENCNGF